MQGNVNFDSNLVKAAAANPEHPLVSTQGEQLIPQNIGGTVNADAQAAQATQAAPAAPAQVEAVDHMNKVSVTLITTLNLGDDRMIGLKQLKKVPVERSGVTVEYNLYNPFLRASKSGSGESGEGLLRQAFSGIVGMAADVSDNKVVYLGTEDQAFKTVNGVAQNIVRGIERLFPIPQNAEILTYTTDESDEPKAICFKDLFRPTAWVVQVPGENPGVLMNNIYVNLQCNVGAAYDTQDLHQFVSKVRSFLLNTVNALHASRSIPVEIDTFIGVSFDSISFEDPGFNETVQLLIQESGFGLVSLANVVTSKEEWIHCDQATLLFGEGSDLLLMTSLVEPEDEDEEDEGEDEDETADDDVDEEADEDSDDEDSDDEDEDAEDEDEDEDEDLDDDELDDEDEDQE